jgi:hypothetical protein
MDPLVARGFKDLGISKRGLIEWCAENARLPAREYWDDQSIQSVIRPGSPTSGVREPARAAR